MRLFIVDYTHSNGHHGTRVVRSRNHTALRHKLWMCSSARITEVKPTRAWRWNHLKFEAVSPRTDLVVEAKAEQTNA